MNIGHNTGWMQPQDDDHNSDSYERAIEHADYLRDEMKDRQMEEMWATKERGEL